MTPPPTSLLCGWGGGGDKGWDRMRAELVSKSEWGLGERVEGRR